MQVQSSHTPPTHVQSVQTVCQTIQKIDSLPQSDRHVHSPHHTPEEFAHVLCILVHPDGVGGGGVEACHLCGSCMGHLKFAGKPVFRMLCLFTGEFAQQGGLIR